MDELTQARAALAALEKREQELLDELHSIRDAARLQRSRVEELVTRLPIAPVDRLPTELLLRAFEFYLEAAAPTCDVYRHGMRELASVSRRWRDVILHSPSLWTTIMVNRWWSEARAKIYVARSSQSLLDVDIGFFSDDDDDGIFAAVLNVLTSCAHRWCHLTIRDDTSLVLEKLNHLSFPSLKRVSIWKPHNILTGQVEPYQPTFLCPQFSPRLEHVHFQANVVTWATFRIPCGTTALSLRFDGSHHIQHPSLFESLSCQGLTSLEVSAPYVDFDLRPSSIQLPRLEKFVCTLTHATTLIHALVAPRLRHFTYCLDSWDDLPSAVFEDLNSKFDNVNYLCLSGFTTQNLSGAVCLAFPNVCDLALCSTGHTLSYPHPTGFPGGDVLHWKNLKSLALEGLEDSESNFLDDLVVWLQQRLNAGQSRLQVNVISYGCASASLFERLPELCYLEWLCGSYKVDMGLYQRGGQPWVEVPNLPSCVVDKLSTAFATGHVRNRDAESYPCHCGIGT